ncbi:MAG: TonB family protein [Gammaproteobacteria bacterium]|nr:TonB family protein [Gammaproteobacteria bacterium]
MTYEQLALAWKPDNKRDRTFNMLAITVLAAFLLAGLVISSIPVPKTKRDTPVPVPERIAKFITEKPVVKPKIEPKPLPKPLPLPKPMFKREKPEQAKPLTKVEKQARKKAAESGLLALTGQLSDLIDTKSVDKMVSGNIRKSASANQEATVNSKILTQNSTKGSGGVSQSVSAAGSTTASIKLDSRQAAAAKRLLAAGDQLDTGSRHSAGKSDAKNIRGGNVRTEEDVAYVMDKHKSVLHALYRRARRSHPGLKGKIVLELTILASGKVSRVRIVSSELNDQALEQNLIERIRQFDFGARPVQSLTLTIPVEFLPS